MTIIENKLPTGYKFKDVERLKTALIFLCALVILMALSYPILWGYNDIINSSKVSKAKATAYRSGLETGKRMK